MATTQLEPPPPRTSRFRSALALLSLRAPFWDRSGKHRFGRMLVRLAYAYLLVLVVLLCLENWLLFRRTTAAESWSQPPGWCAVEDVWLTAADGTRIHGWWMKPRDWRPEQGAMLYCHGNGGNLSWRGDAGASWVHRYHLAVLLFDYPGYGKSGGSPTEAGCYAAADAAYDWLTGEQGVAAERLLLYGGSLGGAVAVDVASRRPHRALILVSTFTTFPDIAQSSYPFVPARWLVRNRFDSLAKIRQAHRPVFVAHSDTDGLIPFSMGRRLFDAANEPKMFVTMHGLHHHDAGSPEAFEALADFLKEQAP
jgi:fermentation-respiration switch protein FrsA (DUF1100 family)